MNTPLERNILLNPGPVTTTTTVKNSLVVPDICHREKTFVTPSHINFKPNSVGKNQTDKN